MQTIAIIPAAGQSRRMGQPKLLLPYGEATVIETVLAAWRGAGVDHVVVVVAPGDDRLAGLCRAAGARVVVPPAAPPDMRDSVEIGIACARQHVAPHARDAWLLAPADMPRLSPDVVRRLIAEHDPARPAILVPTAGGRRGHPVLFPWPMAAKVEWLPPGVGVNVLLSQQPVRLVDVADDSILADMDTPADYRRLRDRHDRH
jgi:molybdenum cofactor cytidylyltransferase